MSDTSNENFVGIRSIGDGETCVSSDFACADDPFDEDANGLKDTENQDQADITMRKSESSQSEAENTESGHCSLINLDGKKSISATRLTADGAEASKMAFSALSRTF